MGGLIDIHVTSMTFRIGIGFCPLCGCSRSGQRLTVDRSGEQGESVQPVRGSMGTCQRADNKTIQVSTKEGPEMKGLGRMMMMNW